MTLHLGSIILLTTFIKLSVARNKINELNLETVIQKF